MKILKFISILAILPMLVSSCKAQDDAPTVQSDPLYEGCCGTTPVEYDNAAAGIHVYVPNVFTPNGDGINDFFLPYVNDVNIEIVDYTIFAADIDSVMFYRQTIVYGDMQNNYAWNGMRPDGSVFKGPFRYSMRAVTPNGVLLGIEGKACRIVCGEDAAVFQTLDGCFYPNQVSPTGSLDTTLPNKESGCF